MTYESKGTTNINQRPSHGTPPIEKKAMSPPITEIRIDINGKHLFGVYKFDEVRGNLILGFVVMTPESEWTLSKR